MASTLLDQHPGTVGVEVRGGRADSAPTLDEIQVYSDSVASGGVRFNAVVEVRMIPAVGKGKPVIKINKIKWRVPG